MLNHIVLRRLQIRPWTDKDGNKRRSTEIIAESVYFGGTKKSGSDNGAAQDFEQIGDPDDDLPF